MNTAETVANAKAQIAEIQCRIDSGVLSKKEVQEAKEEIGNLAMIAVAAELLDEEDESP